MNLYGGNIKIADLVKNEQAKALISREFPGLLSGPLYAFGKNMSLNSVLQKAKGKVPQNKLANVVEKLKEL